MLGVLLFGVFLWASVLVCFLFGSSTRLREPVHHCDVVLPSLQPRCSHASLQRIKGVSRIVNRENATLVCTSAEHGPAKHASSGVAFPNCTKSLSRPSPTPLEDNRLQRPTPSSPLSYCQHSTRCNIYGLRWQVLDRPSASTSKTVSCSEKLFTSDSGTCAVARRQRKVSQRRHFGKRSLAIVMPWCLEPQDKLTQHRPANVADAPPQIQGDMCLDCFSA